LAEAPFELIANPKFLFFTAQHREALSNLEYGLSSAKSVTLLIGRRARGNRRSSTPPSSRSGAASLVRPSEHPTLTREEFVETLASRFDLGADAERSKAALLDGLEVVVRKRQARGQITALVIDEAQALSMELLEEVRLLANMETKSGKLLPVVLAGSRVGGTAERSRTAAVEAACRVTVRAQAAPIWWRPRPTSPRASAGPAATPARSSRAKRHPDLRVLARRAAHDQRHVRQRADLRVCARREADRRQDRR